MTTYTIQDSTRSIGGYVYTLRKDRMGKITGCSCGPFAVAITCKGKKITSEKTTKEELQLIVTELNKIYLNQFNIVEVTK